MIITRLVRRSFGFAVWLGIVNLAASAPLAAQTLTTTQRVQCEQAVQKLSQLNKDLQGVGGCPVSPTSPRIPTAGQPIAPTQPTCTQDSTAIAAFKKAHQDEMNALSNQIDSCDAKVCPPIKPVAGCTTNSPSGRLACLKSLDSDGDGIPDSVESSLIERFSPYLRFTNGETNRPADPTWFIQRSALVVWDATDEVQMSNSVLASNPAAVVNPNLGTSLIGGYLPSSDFTSCHLDTTRNYAIHPSVGSWDNGEDWSAIAQSQHVGMFAHVSPFKPNSSADLAGNHYTTQQTENGPQFVETAPNCSLKFDACPKGQSPASASCAVIPPSLYETTCKHCYKIEYYQFFPVNNDNGTVFGRHEGDLSIVTLVYDVDQDKAVAVSHWVHGIEIRYDLQKPQSQCSTTAGPAFPNQPFTKQQKTCTYIGRSTDDLELMGGSGFTTKYNDKIALAQNNIVSFAGSPDHPTVFEHPIVFIELGSHEFWPTADWSVLGAPAHKGDDGEHSYLAKGIPNLGEIEHPGSGAAFIMTEFLGYWGATDTNIGDPDLGASKNVGSSSPGPSLHTTWNWFLTQRNPISCTAAEN
ncbi:hypothetical protein [Paraburkholderia sediminicola]|uniref:hypothetical protein n=1 Tax=Paraburkholderia sediminicola TaxID=458836 RepID=UPI000EADA0CD